MKKLISSFAAVLFTFTLTSTLSSCSNEKKTIKDDEKCTIKIEMNISSEEYVYEYDQVCQGYISSGLNTVKVKMKMLFEGVELFDTTEVETDNDIDTFYIVKINEEEIQTLSLMRDSLSFSGSIGSVDSMITSYTYTKGSYEDFMDGKVVTISATKESQEELISWMKIIFSRSMDLDGGFVPKEIIDGESSMELSMNNLSDNISKTRSESEGVELKISVAIPITEESCEEMRGNIK